MTGLRLISGFTAAACIFAFSAEALGCDLNGRQIVYRIERCDRGPCQSGGERIEVVGGKLLRHRADAGGWVYYLGRTVRMEDDPLQANSRQYLAPGSANDTHLTASFDQDLLTMNTDVAVRQLDGQIGHNIDTQRIRIRPDCTFCDVLDFTMVARRSDGVELGRIIFKGSNCTVSDLQ